MSEEELFRRCLEFVLAQSGGEWGDKIELEDAAKLVRFVKTLAQGASHDRDA